MDIEQIQQLQPVWHALMDAKLAVLLNAVHVTQACIFWIILVSQCVLLELTPVLIIISLSVILALNTAAHVIPLVEHVLLVTQDGML